ncbi:hypothetical protein MLD38_016779 [Melastoma candidum]|uniref:Uncharacterized protein n=1 Tax=Melastoma candidum TaxID=119954 RepID=A0ACB9QSJ3_9MYRT|nr:hypothetical protein MLD38_016779 [Melastoma candidum]
MQRFLFKLSFGSPIGTIPLATPLELYRLMFRWDLVLHSQNGSALLWSTNVSSTLVARSSGPTVQLLDSGNLVLYTDADKKFVRWQSFDHPTNIQMPYMKFGVNKTSGLNWSFTSWRSYDDPRPGNCTYKIDTTGYPQAFLYKDGKPHFRVGSWTGSHWNGIPEMTDAYVSGFSFVNDEEEVSFTFRNRNSSFTTIIVVNETGTIQPLNWIDESRMWAPIYTGPRDPCDIYNQCGPNSNCDPDIISQYMCSCLPGFEPKSPINWYLRYTAEGCVRKKGASICRSGEDFKTIPNVKIPDTSASLVGMSLSLTECKQACLGNCSCMAYASANNTGAGSGCFRWHGDLVDIKTFSNAGQDLYVRVDATELGQHSKKTIQKIMAALAALFLLLLVSFLLIIKRRRDSWRAKLQDQMAKPDTDLPCYDLSFVAAATDNFSIANRLGSGGFGTVYRGVMSDGTEIAVKRLSEGSGQGDEEFRNEVNLIAKLQHRNLVKMLGFCLQNKEKILIYEYLPNKSLDAFLFDESKKSLLDWRLRFDILMGIARGLMYLHQDSRLRIIHRDLKASNVLLDSAMQPKISDFGMARMCGGDQSEGTTNRVVGTYGYMSPEYAMEGLFSVKSDVYSYGVLLLEIVSAKKISSHHEETSSTNLVGHVWELWKEGRCVEIVDESMDVDDPQSLSEMLKCIQIGLLCVQELPRDRPTMSMVVFMLGNDRVLPLPEQPAYTMKKSNMGTENSTSDGAASVNQATISIVEGR